LNEALSKAMGLSFAGLVSGCNRIIPIASGIGANSQANIKGLEHVFKLINVIICEA
jgi:hypothetical protein